jgi:hypothetical protein
MAVRVDHIVTICVPHPANSRMPSFAFTSMLLFGRYPPTPRAADADVLAQYAALEAQEREETECMVASGMLAEQAVARVANAGSLADSRHDQLTVLYPLSGPFAAPPPQSCKRRRTMMDCGMRNFPGRTQREGLPTARPPLLAVAPG